jgi:hypothetical protein
MYGIEAVLPIELTELTWHTDANTDFPANTTNLHEELEFVDEVRIGATLREAALKQKIAARHNKKVIKRNLKKAASSSGETRRTPKKGNSLPTRTAP